MSPESVFRWLLRLLPVEFRADHDRDMEQVFRAQHRDARGEGRAGLARMWWRTVLDVLRTAPREHFDPLRQDAGLALRALVRHPGFAMVAVLTLALGIGANTAMFGLARAVLLRPLPYPEPDRLVLVWNRWTDTPEAALSNPEYLDYEERMAGLRLGGMATRGVNVRAGGEPVRVSGAYVTAGLVDVLGVPPLMGRGFSTEEETPGRDRVAVLSHSLWTTQFGGRADVLGRAVTVDGVPREIVGVMPAAFRLPTDLVYEPAQVLLPLALDRAASRAKRGGHYIIAFARLAPGVSIAQARAEAAGVLAPLMRAYPDEHDQGDFGIAVVPLRSGLLGPARPVLTVLLAAVALVLLMACANVACLLLARGEARRHELAVRAALGATRLRLVRQVLTETCVLSLLGALLGVPLALAMLKGVLALDPGSLPRVQDAALDAPVFAFTTAVAVGAGLLFGLVPALQMSRVGVGEVLGEAPRGGIGGRRRIRRALVALQVATAVVLLVGAGLLVKSFARLLSIPTGVTAADVLTLRVTAPESSYPGRAEVTAFFARLTEDLRALPGVRVVGAANGLPLAVPSGDWNFDVEGRAPIPGKGPAADWFAVTPGYFEALGVPLRRGRLPSPSDAEGAPPVIFFNEAAARRAFPGEDAVGKRIRLSRSAGPEQPWRTVAGVVADVRHRRRDEPPRPEMYIPHAQFLHFAPRTQARTMSVVLKTSRPPLTLVEEARAVLRGLDPQVPASQVRTMEDVLASSVSGRRRDVWLMGAFAAIALLLAAIGVYGVTAWDASQRVREFGVRMALGATPADVRRLVLAQGLRPVDAGLVAGIGAAALLGGALRSMLFEVDPRDLTVFAAIALLLLLVGALACLLPAVRATRRGPARSLREE